LQLVAVSDILGHKIKGMYTIGIIIALVFIYLGIGVIFVPIYYWMHYLYEFVFLIVGFGILIYLYKKRDTSRDSPTRSLSGVFGLAAEGLFLRQEMLREPFFQEITEAKIRFRPVEHLHKELAFIFQDSGIAIRQHTIQVEHGRLGTTYLGTANGKPDIEIGLSDEQVKKRKLRTTIKRILILVGIILVVLPLSSILSLFGFYDQITILMMIIAGITLIILGLMIRMPKHRLAPFFGNYTLCYLGYVPKVPEHKDIPYKEPDYMVLQVFHSFSPHKDALENPEVQGRTRLLDYVTARIEKLLPSEPREITPSVVKDHDISLVISGRVSKYSSEKERDILDEVFERWPINEMRYSTRQRSSEDPDVYRGDS